MYLSFYGLAEKPFSITPDPRYLFLGGRHAEALAHLVYGITEAGGFVQLTGEVGTGKTTVVRSLLARQPDNTEIALILNPRMNALEFIATLCAELGISRPTMHDLLHKHQIAGKAIRCRPDTRRPVVIGGNGGAAEAPAHSGHPAISNSRLEGNGAR